MGSETVAIACHTLLSPELEIGQARLSSQVEVLVEAPRRSPSAGAGAAGGGPRATGTPKPKASKKKKTEAPQPEPEDASLSTETLLKYYEDKRRVVRFDQLIGIPHVNMGNAG